MIRIICLFFIYFFFNIFISCQRYNTPIDTTIPSDKYNSEELELVWKVDRDQKFNPEGSDIGYQICNIKFEGDYFYICSDFSLRKYKKNNGDMLWEFQLYPHPGSTRNTFWQMTDMILENGKIFLISAKMVHCVSTETGTAIWNLDLNPLQTALSHGELCHSPELIFISDVGAKHQVEVVAISKQSGTIVWRNNNFAERKDLLAKKDIIIGPPAYSKYNDRIYISGFFNEGLTQGRIFCLEAKTGRAILEKSPPNYTLNEYKGYVNCSKIMPPLYPTGTKAQLQIFPGGVLIKEILATKLTFDLDLIVRDYGYHNGDPCQASGAQINPVLIDNRYYVYYGYGVLDGYGFGYDITNMEKLWSIRLGETSRAGSHTLNSNPVFIDKDKVYITTDDGWLFGNDPKTGELLISSSLSRQTYVDEKGDKRRTGYLGPYGVEGDYIYYVGSHIYCYKRKRV